MWARAAWEWRPDSPWAAKAPEQQFAVRRRLGGWGWAEAEVGEHLVSFCVSNESGPPAASRPPGRKSQGLSGILISFLTHQFPLELPQAPSDKAKSKQKNPSFPHGPSTLSGEKNGGKVRICLSISLTFKASDSFSH